MGGETLKRLQRDLKYLIDLAYLANNGHVSLRTESLTALIESMKVTVQEVKDMVMLADAGSSDAQTIAADERAKLAAERMNKRTKETQAAMLKQQVEASTKMTNINVQSAEALLETIEGSPDFRERWRKLIGGEDPLSNSSSGDKT